MGRAGDKVISAGIDCGARSTKAVIMKDGEIVGKGSVMTGPDQKRAVQASLEMAMTAAGIAREEISRIGGTGSGKEAIEMADIRVNDILAMALAGRYFFPDCRTVADVGAEEARAARMDQSVYPVDFSINDKCAAGAGAFLEAMGRALETPLEEMGMLALKSSKEIPLNAQCAVFAESEVVGLIHTNTPTEDIAKAIHDAMASRIASMVRRVGVRDKVVIMGGVGRNMGFVEAMRRELRLETIFVPGEPEYGAATGAAIAAAKEA